MFYDQMRRSTVLRQFGVIAVLISAMAVLSGCVVFKGIGEVTVGGLETAGEATVGALETAGRATVGGLQWVADGGVGGIRGRMHGFTEKPFLIITGLRFPGIKLRELSVLSMQAVDGRGKGLPWRQGAWTKSKYGPALTITVIPEEATRIVDVTGMLIYRGGRWVLSARCVRLPSESEIYKGHPWRTELINVNRR